MKKKLLFVIALMALLPLTITSCSDGKNYPYIGENGNWFVNNEDTGIPATGPAGQDGSDGENGTNGSDGENGTNGATPTIGENGNWWIGGADTGIPATGSSGENGTDGETPFIGQNGNWWIGSVDTGIAAEGKTPVITIGHNGNWLINGEDTGMPSKGEDGSRIEIKDGYWYIDEVNTGIKAEGMDGTSPVITIGENGNWFIDGVDTGMPSQGEDGSKIEIIDGYWYIDEVNTGIKAIGEDGLTPFIGENGNWRIGENDTGVKAEGKDGHSPEITIGENGNWFIDGVDTGKNAITLDYYTVTLDLNGGYVDGSQTFTDTYTVREGHTIPDLPIPTKTDFEFLGWYTGLDQTSDRFTTTTQVYSDLNLTAVYRSLAEDTYTIKWVNYDGTELEVDNDVLYGTIPTYDGEIPTKPSDFRFSYEFADWSPTVEPASKDVVYVAQFKDIPLEYTITYELNGHGKLVEPVNVVTYGDALQYPELDKTDIVNLAFDGWYLDAEFHNRVSFPYYPQSNTTLYAKWVAIDEGLFSTYPNNDGTCTIRSFFGTNAEYETIAIPSIINGSTVTGIDSAFQNNQQIKNIILPDTIQNINDNAFKNSSLESINLPNSVITIGNSAFENCQSLKLDMTALPNLESVGDCAFADSNITNFNFTESTNLYYIGSYAFRYANLEQVDLYNANQLTELNGDCFFFCDNLISVKLPQRLETIGNTAFYYCSNLTTIEFPSSLKTIGSQAFSYCTSLTTLILPISINTINNEAFEYCTSLSLYCEQTSKPYGWEDTFAGDALPYWYSESEPQGAGTYWHYIDDEEGNQVPQKW